MVKITRQILCMSLWCALVVCASPTHAAELQTKLSQTQIKIGETLQVEFTGKQQDFQKIDFTPFKNNFTVGSVSRRSSVKIVNGVRTEEAVVIVNLVPKRLGNLNLPAISFGTAKSQAATVQVVANPTNSAAPKPIFMQLTAQPQTVYVQQQIEVKLLVWMDSAYNVRGNLSTLNASKDAAVKKIGKSRTYQTNHQGRRYTIHEDLYVLHPQSSGQIQIKPVTLNGSYVQTGTNRNTAVREMSNHIVLNVQPIPDTFTGITWLPASEVKLSETWSKDLKSVQAGTSIVRTITLHARGLTSSQLPNINTGNIKHSNIYPEQAQGHDQLENRTSQKTQKFIVIPNQEGRYTIPEIKVPWWDIANNRMTYATLPAKKMVVTPAPAGLVVERPPELALQAQQVAPNNVSRIWQWLSLLLLTILLLSLAWIWKTWGLWTASQESQHQYSKREQHKQLNLRKINKRLQTHCAEDDFNAIKTALLDWGTILWQQQTPNTLTSLAQRVDDESLAAELQKLDQVLYSDHYDWSAASLGVALQAYMERSHTPSTTPKHKTSRLEKLYRLR